MKMLEEEIGQFRIYHHAFSCPFGRLHILPRLRHRAHPPPLLSRQLSSAIPAAQREDRRRRFAAAYTGN